MGKWYGYVVCCFVVFSAAIGTGCPPGTVPCPPCPCLDENNAYLKVVNRNTDRFLTAIALKGEQQSDLGENLLEVPLYPGETIIIKIPTQGLIGDWNVSMKHGYCGEIQAKSSPCTEEFMGFPLPEEIADCHCFGSYDDLALLENVKTGIEYTLYF